MLLLSNVHISPYLLASGKENLFPTQLTEENILNSNCISVKGGKKFLTFHNYHIFYFQVNFEFKVILNLHITLLFYQLWGCSYPLHSSLF